MRVRLSIRAIFLTSLFLILSFTASLVHAYDTSSAVRVIHGVVDVKSADFYLDEIFLGTLNYFSSAPYMPLEAGEHSLRVYAPGTDTDPIFEKSFTAQADTHMNLVLMGTSTEPRMELYPVDRTPLDDASGVSHVNLIHAVAGGEPATITATATDGTVITLATDLAFGESQAFDLPAGSYLINAPGLLTDVRLTSNSDMTFAVLMLGAADGSTPPRIMTSTNSTRDVEPAGYARFVHTIPDDLPLDLYLNGVLMGGGLNFGRITAYFGLQPGTYTVDLYYGGSDPTGTTPLFTGELEFTENHYQTVLLAIKDSAWGLVALEDDMSVPPQGSGGLAIINATTGNLDMAIDGEPTITDLQPWAISERINVSTDIHPLTFDADVALTVDEYLDFQIHPATVANLQTLIILKENIFILRDCPVIP